MALLHTLDSPSNLTSTCSHPHDSQQRVDVDTALATTVAAATVAATALATTVAAATVATAVAAATLFAAATVESPAIQQFYRKGGASLGFSDSWRRDSAALLQR